MSRKTSRQQVSGKSERTLTNDGFVNLASRQGIGADNLLSQGTYMPNMLTRNRLKLENMYRGSWIVGVAIDSVAEDMTRAGINIKGDNTPEEIQKIQSQMTRLGLWNSLLNTIKWGRLYGGAIAYIDIDGQDASTPLNIETVGMGQFVGLRTYDRWQLQPSLATVETGRDAGLPVYYTVIQDLANGTLSNLKMHHSRAIRQIGIQLPAMQAITEQWWGESVIERLYDRLIAFDTATSGAANLIQKAHLRTIKIDKLREVFAAGGKAEENLMTMFSYMGIMQNNEGITLLDSADEFQTTSYSFAGLSDMILQFGQQISGATGIPLVRLFGQSPAGLSATGEADMRMYYDNINAQQETDLREGMLKLLRILHKSVLNTTAADTFDFDFSSLWQASTKEKAEIANATVTAIKGAIEAGVIDNVTALQELKQSSEHTGIFTNITEEQIAEAKSLPPPVPIESAPVTADRQSVTDRIKTWLSNA